MRYLLVMTISLYFGACSSPEKPVFKSLENVKLNSFSIKKPYSVTLNADAIYHNPNILGADITGMDLDVFVNKKKVTHITQDVIAKMPPKSDFVLPILLKVPLEEIFQDLNFKDLLGLKMIEYELKGHLKVGFGGIDAKIPFSHSGEEALSL